MLFYPNPKLSRTEAALAVRAGLTAFNVGRQSGNRVHRALVLAAPPDAAHGEITDKGYIAQSLARTMHAEAIVRLFSDPPPTDVIVL
jgi:feruloyl-CoA synthase